MKLYLSSFRLGDNPQRLSQLFSHNKTIAVISNAKDAFEKEVLQQRTAQEIHDVTSLGLFPEVLDLKEYFGKKEELIQKLNTFDGVWVVGGNTFTLRVAMAESGFDKWVLSKTTDRDFVYAGYSAGICVLSPTLKGLDIVDNPNEPQKLYGKETMWEGLWIVDYSFAPHYRSDHPESSLVEKEVEYMIQQKMPYKTLHDGEVLITHT